MLSVELRFVMQGKEVSADSFVEVIVQEVRASLRKEISRTLANYKEQGFDSLQRVDSEMSRQAVSIREAARLLSLSPRTIHNYISSKAIRTIRVGDACSSL
jgi:hypothetical protein